MRIVQNHSTVIGVWGLQYYNKDRVYRLSKYIKTVPVTDDDTILMGNMITREIISLSKKEYDIIMDESVRTKHPILYEYLISRWWMIPIEMDEKSMIYTFKNSMRMDAAIIDSIKTYVILPTTSCNAQCYYCYEAGMVEPKTMSKETAIDVVKYISETHKVGTTIHIHWFGGEPTCNMDAIDTICTGLAEKDIKFVSTMVSNAYLLDNYTILAAKSIWNLKTIQITIDGLGSTYNAIKNYSDADTNPFNKVMKNIELLLYANIEVVIRLNIGTRNIQSLYEVIDYMDNKFKNTPNRHKFHMFPIPLFDSEELGFDPRTSEENDLIYAECFKLEDYLYNKGLLDDVIRYYNNFPYSVQCMADRPDSILIDPEGRLGKCEHHLKDTDFFDTIYGASVLKYDEILKYKQPINEYAECGSCFYYPACNKIKLCDNESKCDNNIREYKKRMVDRSMLKIYKEFKEKNGQ